MSAEKINQNCVAILMHTKMQPIRWYCDKYGSVGNNVAFAFCKKQS